MRTKLISVGQLGEVAVLHQQEEVKEHVQVGRPVVCVEQATDALLQDALRWKRRMATTCR